MKVTSSLAIAILVGMTTISGIPQSFVNPQSVTVLAAETKADVTGLNFAQKIDLITKEKGKFGGGDALRRFFFGDLEPVGIQPGGAGMVVNLYNKANNYTFSYCSTFDVVVALKKGKVAKFAAAEVK